MNKLMCPKCNIPYSDPTLKKCLLCGGELVVTQTMEELPKSKKVKEIEKQLKATQVDDDKVPVFDSTNGFKKRNTPKDLAIGQLQADEKAIEKRLEAFENIYRKEHPQGKRWYTSFGTWFVILLALGMFYLIYLFVQNQGGLPPEFYEFLRRIGI